MSKHTRGPWEVETRPKGFTIYGEDSTLVVSREFFRNTETQEHHANARLIAAAPELLDAAQAARAILQACGEWGNPFIAPQVKIIEDAIKKATGGEG